jgi:hypothetical protein
MVVKSPACLTRYNGNDRASLFVELRGEDNEKDIT